MKNNITRFNALSRLVERLETEGLKLTVIEPDGGNFSIPDFFTDAAIDAIYDLAVAAAQSEYED